MWRGRYVTRDASATAPSFENAQALERDTRCRLLWNVPEQTQAIASNVIVGGITAAATTGALIAIGHRLGSTGLPFAAMSGDVFHRTVSGGSVSLVFAGLVLHVVASFVWSWIFLWAQRAGVRMVAAAIGVAVLEFLFSWTVARITGGGLGAILPLGDRLVLAVVFAVTLVVGMRFAFSIVRNA
jgi:hypothetical protein